MQTIDQLLKDLGISKAQGGCSTGKAWFGSGAPIIANSPVDGKELGSVHSATVEDYEQILDTATSAFEQFRMLPAPQRGELVRCFGRKPSGNWCPMKWGNPIKKGWVKFRR
jgi:aldehyde dehydrogenase (NAD+)